MLGALAGKLRTQRRRRPSRTLMLNSTSVSVLRLRRSNMFPMRSPLVFVLAVTGLLWVSPLSRAQDSRIQGQAAATAASAVALSEVPTGQAVVMYQNGGLTVEAQSAPLIDILREVCGQ